MKEGQSGEPEMPKSVSKPVIVKLWKVKGSRVSKPFERVLKVLLSPELTGSKELTLMFAILGPGTRSPYHEHENSETMYIVTGRGKARVEEGYFEVEPDTVIYAPPGIKHQIINNSDETMKIACIHIPPVPSDYVQKQIELAKEAK